MTRPLSRPGTGPAVSIGLPVRNGENFIRVALESLLSQTFDDLEVIIGDNASEDATEAICREFAAKDRRVRYERHAVDRGAPYNYNFVFGKATGRYFKWAAHDDACAPGFLERCVEALEKAPAAVLAYTRAVHVDAAGKPLYPSASSLHLTGSPEDRFGAALRSQNWTWPVFGLMRRDVLARTRLHDDYPGADHVLLAELSLHGEFHEIPEELFFAREHTGRSVTALPRLRERVAWHNPARARQIRFITWAQLEGLLSAVSRAPLTARQRRRAYGRLGPWIRRNSRPLVVDFIFAGQELASRVAGRVPQANGAGVARRAVPARTAPLGADGSREAASQVGRRTGIIFLLPDLRVGGGQQLLLTALRHLDRDRFDAEVAYLLPEREMEAEFRAAGYPPIFLDHRGGVGTVATALRLARLARRTRAQIIHSNSPLDDRVGRLGALIARVPLVSHLTMPRPAGRGPSGMSYRLGRLLVDRFIERHYVALSRDVINTHLPALGVPQERIHLVYPGIEMGGSIKKDDVRRERTRRELGVDSGAPLIVNIGRLVPQKRQDLLVPLMASVRRRIPSAELLIVGEGPDREALRGAIGAAGLVDAIHLLGTSRDIPDVLAAADCFVLSSDAEGFGIVVAEAMAAGCPVVSFDLPAVVEFVEDGLSGSLVRRGDVDGLADSVVRVLADPSSAKAMGERGRTAVRDRFDAATSARGLERVYEGIQIERRPKASGARRSPSNGILFVSAAGGLGGSTRSLITVLSGLAGSAERILAAPGGGRLADVVDRSGLAERRISLPQPRGRLGRFSRLIAAVHLGLWALRNRGRVTAIHANGASEVSIVALAALVLRVPIVVWSHHYTTTTWMRRIAPVIRRLPLRITWTAVSPLGRDVLADAELADPSAIEIIPNPIDPADVVGPRSVSRRIRVAYVGSDKTYKGFQFLPQIIDASKDVPVTWLVFSEPNGGDPASWARLRSSEHAHVEFRGLRSDPKEIYAESDIVICPSLEESFCRVAAEAMLNGLPVIGSDLPPLRDLLGPGAGILVPPGDVVAAADAVRRLARDRALRQQLGSRGRELAGTFAPGPIVARLGALYGIEDGRAASERSVATASEVSGRAL